MTAPESIGNVYLNPDLMEAIRVGVNERAYAANRSDLVIADGAHWSQSRMQTMVSSFLVLVGLFVDTITWEGGSRDSIPMLTIERLEEIVGDYPRLNADDAEETKTTVQALAPLSADWCWWMVQALGAMTTTLREDFDLYQMQVKQSTAPASGNWHTAYNVAVASWPNNWTDLPNSDVDYNTISDQQKSLMWGSSLMANLGDLEFKQTGAYTAYVGGYGSAIETVRLYRKRGTLRIGSVYAELETSAKVYVKAGLFRGQAGDYEETFDPVANTNLQQGEYVLFETIEATAGEELETVNRFDGNGSPCNDLASSPPTSTWAGTHVGGWRVDESSVAWLILWEFTEV